MKHSKTPIYPYTSIYSSIIKTNGVCRVIMETCPTRGNQTALHFENNKAIPSLHPSISDLPRPDVAPLEKSTTTHDTYPFSFFYRPTSFPLDPQNSLQRPYSTLYFCTNEIFSSHRSPSNQRNHSCLTEKRIPGIITTDELLLCGLVR